jgi:hypothetical protein
VYGAISLDRAKLTSPFALIFHGTTSWVIAGARSGISAAE